MHHRRIELGTANLELRQPVTNFNSPSSEFSNGTQELKYNDCPPPNARSNEINLKEIEAALKEFDSPENPTIIGKATCPELRPHAASEEVHATTKMDINSAAFISAITPDLNSNEVLRLHASSEDIHAKPNPKGINSINSSAFISVTD